MFSKTLEERVADLETAVIFDTDDLSSGGALVLPDAEIYVGLAGVATARAMSGVIAISSTGVTSFPSSTGSGAVVLATSPTLVTPNIGVAIATSINKVAITAPTTAATLTLADGATLTASATATVSGTNTGDNAVNSTSAAAASFIAGAGALTGPAAPLTIGTAAASAVGDFATSTQGSKADAALPATGGLMSGSITLGENTALALDPAGSADEKWSGITVTGTAGATVAVGDLLYLDVTAGEWLLADADAAATSGDVPLAICILASTDGAATNLLLQGTIRSAAFPASVALGAPVYVDVTAGDISATKPSGVDDVVRKVGWALTVEPNTFLFSPSADYITVTG